LIGEFKNSGQAWCREPESVLVHDFPQDAIGQAIPFGIYEINHNHGFVRVGDCSDTPRFAAESVVDWWWSEGQRQFPREQRLLILADAGGSNSCRSRVWKAQLQEQLCDTSGLEVTVCHYPPGCSKWNPIEHRLFSFISLNWAGKPLRSFALMKAYIASTETRTGLTVTARLQRGAYEIGERVTDDDMRQLQIQHDAVCPQWNYTLQPRTPPHCPYWDEINS
jgi:hypothetical protein